MDAASHIHLKGAREHNLRNLELRIPRGKLVVLTGPSGSGKSSLAFDTIYAEGYRKYMESLSASARQVLEQLKRPDIDFIHGLSPVLAIEQRTGGSSPRSTVATVTEVADYARLLWALCGEQRCPKDGGRVEKRSLDDCLVQLLREAPGERAIVLAPWMTAKPSVGNCCTRWKSMRSTTLDWKYLHPVWIDPCASWRIGSALLAARWM